MSKTKKYDFRAVQNNSGWTAEIIRRATSRKVVVSKSKSGFSTESEALKWGDEELKAFILKLSERNKHDSLLHKQKDPQPS